VSVWLLLVDDARLKRHDVTDGQWQLLAPLMPAHPRQGHRWSDHRMVIDAVFHRTRTGTPWRDLPERFGPWQTIYNRHRRWSADGTWEQILSALQAGCDEDEGAAWTVAVDSTVVRAHQHAAGARHDPPKDVDAQRLAPAGLNEPTRRPPVKGTGGRVE
jgi:transposase